MNQEKELKKAQSELIDTIGACIILMKDSEIDTKTIKVLLHSEVDNVIKQLEIKGVLN